MSFRFYACERVVDSPVQCLRAATDVVKAVVDDVGVPSQRECGI